ncbi:MFS transporter [Bacillus sp. FJAT-27264]|uniref:MFS transporter n=1 Tax=Paenibacillus sp. (strain DSM 101736 / FJAT-27264) TaxID=1850362 RepID=UPI000807FFDD|nr:MFS transporter [Bacillus sp. FJAT-27264]OBZ16155.1 MFS transporter [Bacillus sp. FJAT-27264]
MATWFLIVIYLAFVSLGLPDSLLGSAWPVIWPEIGSSLGSAGLISMIIAGGTIVSSLASGRMIQRLGTGKITLFSCLLTAVALLGFSMAPSMFWFIVLAIPLGLGAGSVDAALNHYVAENYKAHHMNWLHCFWGVGATMGPIIMATYMAGQHSWRGGYAAVAIIQAILVIILFVTLPLWKRVAAIRDLENSEHTVQDILREEKAESTLPTKVLQLRGVKPSLLAFLMYCGVETTVGLWGASYLVGTKNVTAEMAAGWISLYYGGITIGRLITGFITLKVHNRLLIRYGQLVTIAGGIILLLPFSASFSMLGFILIGLGLAPIYPGLLHETPARFGKEHSAKLMGYQMAVAYSGTTLLPPLFGLLAAKTSTDLFPVVVLILLVLMLFSVETVNRLLSKPDKVSG